jgi:hypothetical protein
VFVGRGSTPGDREVTVSAVVSGWRSNRAGDLDGLFLEDGSEVRFPPHRARELAGIVAEGAAVEVKGIRKKDHLHAHRITDALSGSTGEGHPGHPGDPRKAPLGHTARFMVDHTACGVVVLGAQRDPRRSAG